MWWSLVKQKKNQFFGIMLSMFNVYILFHYFFFIYAYQDELKLYFLRNGNFLFWLSTTCMMMVWLACGRLILVLLWNVSINSYSNKKVHVQNTTYINTSVQDESRKKSSKMFFESQQQQKSRALYNNKRKKNIWKLYNMMYWMDGRSVYNRKPYCRFTMVFIIK